jgi:Nif-specific regulatory protein
MRNQTSSPRGGARAALPTRHPDFSRLVGESRAMRHVLAQVAQAAPATATVLIQGESGTGKEVIAQALHLNSPQACGPLVKVNCGALPEALVEAELFGHERGAFTGAVERKPGRFELADGGSLLLDEVGELSLFAQAKLLRVLQEREFERVGGAETIKVNVRVIAATNVDLAQAVQSGRFREDLFYRLNVFTISVPALRERREDICPLAERFLDRHASAHGKRVTHFSPSARELLVSYDWPGNVRELANAVERAVVVCDGPVIHHYHLPPALQALLPTTQVADAGLFAAVEAYEREMICAALRAVRGSRSAAARMLKVSTRVLSYKIGKHKIVCDDFRA